MKSSEIGRALLGAAVVYVAMAACTGAERAGSGGAGGHTIANSSAGGATGHGGAGVQSGGHGGQGGAWDSGILDVLTDPVPDAAADPISGSRLKAKFRMGDDGSKAYLPYVWFDSQRNEDCSFVTAADGKERCLPIQGYNASISYLDAACTQPVAVGSPGCAPTYAVEIGYLTCSTLQYHLYPAGAAIQLPLKLYAKSGNVCSAKMPDPSYAYFQAGAEIAAGSFVGSSIGHD